MSANTGFAARARRSWALLTLDLIGSRDSKGRPIPPCSGDTIIIARDNGKLKSAAFVDCCDKNLILSNEKGICLALKPGEALRLAAFILSWRVRDVFGARKKAWYRANAVRMGLTK